MCGSVALRRKGDQTGFSNNWNCGSGGTVLDAARLKLPKDHEQFHEQYVLAIHGFIHFLASLGVGLPFHLCKIYGDVDS